MIEMRLTGLFNFPELLVFRVFNIVDFSSVMPAIISGLGKGPFCFLVAAFSISFKRLAGYILY